MENAFSSTQAWCFLSHAAPFYLTEFLLTKPWVLSPRPFVHLPPPFHSFFCFRLSKIFPLASLSRQYLLFGAVHPGFLLAMTDVSLIIPLPCHPSLLSLQLIIAPPLSVHFKQASLKLATPLTLSEKSLSPSNPRSAQNDSSLEAWGVLFLFRNE